VDVAGRADVVRIVVGASWGTGFAIAPDRILTALHVVGKVVDGELRLHAEAIRIIAAVAGGADVRFPVAVCSRDDIGDDFDPELDWAAIRVDADAFPGLALPALGAVAESDQDATWSTYGFPESSPDLGKATGGAVSSTGALIRLASATQAAIQLYSREAGAAQGGAVHGYSGGPVIVDDHIIGLISAAGAEAGRSVEGTLYAIPLTALAKRLGLALRRDRPVASAATAPASTGAAPGPAAWQEPAPGAGSPAAGGRGAPNAVQMLGGAAMPEKQNGTMMPGASPGALADAGQTGPAAAPAPVPPQIYALPQMLGGAGATVLLGTLLGALIAFGVPGWGWGPVGVLGLLSCVGFVRQLGARDPVRGAQRSFARLLVLLGMLAVVVAAAGLAAGVAERFAAAAPLAGALRDVLGWPWQLELGLLAVGVTAEAAALPLLVVLPQAVAEAAAVAAPRAAILEPATGPPLPEVFHERIRLLFEKRAFEAFRLDGYDAAAGCLTGECRDASGPHRAVVRCDDRGTPVGEADAAAVAAYAAALSGGDRARVYYATPAAAAIDPALAARFRSLAFVSEADLLGSLVYFDGYLRRVIELYEKDPLPYSHTAVKKSLADTFVAPRFAFHGATGEPPRGPLRDYLDDWLADQRPRQIALLADYGMGKSSFLKHYAWHLARARLAGGSGRIPILLSLTGKSPRNQPGADGLLQAFINQYQLRCEVAAFHVLMQAGRLVFLIDAFDEMDLVGDRAMRLDHFAELWRLYTPGNKLLFAGRPTFFPDEAELDEAFRIADRGPDRLTGSVYCERLALSPLADDDIERSFDCYFDPATARRHFAWVRGNPRLLDLARRPAMMHIIRDTIDELRSGQADPVALREASLLRLYTDHWIVREEGGKQRKLLVNRDLRARFSENLAVWMFTGSRRTVQSHELGELFAQWFPDEAARVAAGAGAVTAHVQTHIREGIETDLRNCTFLVRDPDGAYSFAHKPFLEYFVAAAIDRGLHEPSADGRGQRERDPKQRSPRQLGEVPEALQLVSWGTEVALHVADLWLLRHKDGSIPTADVERVVSGITRFQMRMALWRVVQRSLAGRTGKRPPVDRSPVQPVPREPLSWRKVIVSTLSLVLPLRGALSWLETVTDIGQPSMINTMQVALRAGVPFAWLRHEMFRKTWWHRLYWWLGTLDAERCLSILDLSGARFDGATLQGLDLSGRSLRGASFARAQLTSCRLDRADLSDANLSRAQLSDTSLVGAMLQRATCTSGRFLRCRLEFADAHDAVFEDCHFGVGTTLRFAVLRGASLRHASFADDLNGIDLVGIDLTGADLRGANLARATGPGASLARAKQSGDPVSAGDLSPCTLGALDAIAWSPDDACLLVRSRGSAWVLDAGSGALIRRLQTPGARVLAAAFRSATEVVAVTSDGWIAVHDLAAGTRRARAGGAEFSAAGVSPSGTWFAAVTTATATAELGVVSYLAVGSCADGHVPRIRIVSIGDSPGSPVPSVAIDDGGRIIAVVVPVLEGARIAPVLRVLDAGKASSEGKLDLVTSIPLSLSTPRALVSPNGTAVGVACGSQHWTARVSELAAGRPRGADVLIDRAAQCWSPDGGWSDARPQTQVHLPEKLMDRLRSGARSAGSPTTLRAHRDHEVMIAGADRMVIADVSGACRELPVSGGYRPFADHHLRQGSVIEDLRFIDADRLATAGLEAVRTWDLRALSGDSGAPVESGVVRFSAADLGEPPTALLADGRPVRCGMIPTADIFQDRVLCAGRTRYASATLLVDYDNHSQIRVSEPGGAFLRVFLFDRGDDTGRPLSDLSHAALSPGDRWLALATREVSVFDLEGDDTVRLAQRIPIVASALAFLGDGSLLLGRSDGRLHRFLRDGDALPVETIRGSPAAAAPITALAAVGQQVAIATGDGQIYTWAPGDATATQLAGPAAVASRLALSPDGRMLAAACDDDIVRVFDLPSRSLVARLYHLEAGWAAVRADGKYDHGGEVSRLAVASQMRTYRLADLDEMIPDGRIRRAEGAVATSTRPQGDEGPRRAENATAAAVQGTEG
jgi:uncharacterized protein YjbI with pentapeptide repeats